MSDTLAEYAGDASQAQEIRPTVKVANPIITGRELIVKLAYMEDLDAEVCLSFHGSDPIQIKSVEESGDGQIILADS